MSMVHSETYGEAGIPARRESVPMNQIPAGTAEFCVRSQRCAAIGTPCQRLFLFAAYRAEPAVGGISMSAGAGPGRRLLHPVYPGTELVPQHQRIVLYRADHVAEPFTKTGICLSRGKIPCLVGKAGVLDFPLFDFDWQPKGIDAECDNGQ